MVLQLQRHPVPGIEAELGAVDGQDGGGPDPTGQHPGRGVDRRGRHRGAVVGPDLGTGAGNGWGRGLAHRVNRTGGPTGAPGEGSFGRQYRERMSVDPATPVGCLRLASDGPEQTRAIAAALAPALAVGDLLVLTGDLGAGKTCFAQGLGVGLGIDEPITSPTFTLANRYRGRLVLHHLDVYRLSSEADAADLDLGELVETGVVVIEWGDRIAGLLPPGHLVVRLRYPDLEPDLEAAASFDDGAADDEIELDRRIIEIQGPVGERRLDRLVRPWIIDLEPDGPGAAS